MYNQIDSNKRKTWVLMFIFIAFICVIGFFLNWFFGFGYEIVVFALIVSLITAAVSYFHGDKIALKTTGAKQIEKEDNPYVYRIVENLCITAGVPTPKIYIMETQALNAFATGRDPEHASIAITTGLINALENEELEGVIAHELSHIKNFDIRLMTIVVVLVGTLALVSDMFLRVRFFGGRDSQKNTGGILAIIGLILIVLSPIIANIIKLTISRKREYLADASGALLTRYPEGLARALEKISASNAPLVRASAATAHLFIDEPLKKRWFASLFSTHPPIEDRVQRLRTM